MADLEQLSDDQLRQMARQKMAAQQPATSDKPLESMSDDELRQMARRKSAGIIPPAKPPTTPTWQAGLEGFGQGAAMGYLPQLQAATEPLVNRILSPFSGESKEALPDYVTRRDENIARQEKLSQEHPAAYGLGELGGAIASTPILAGGVAKLPGMAAPAAGLLGKLGQGVVAGGIQGALQNPGDVAGKLNVIQAKEREEGLKGGSILGGGTALAGSVLEKAAKLPGAIQRSLSKSAETDALKAAGVYKIGDLNKIVNRGKASDIAKEMFDSGLVKPGHTFEDVAQKSTELKKQVGQKIGDIYDKVQRDSIIHVDPKALSEELLGVANDPKIRPRIGVEEYDKKIASVVDDVIREPGKLSDVRHLNDIIGDIDSRINYSKKNLEMSEVQQGLHKLRGKLRELVNHVAEETGKAMGDEKMGSELKALNKRYSNLTDIAGISQARVNRENANQFFSLTDKLIGGGAAAYGAVPALMQGDLEGALKGAAIGGAASLASRAARRYGAPITTQAKRGAAGLLGAIPGVVTQGAGQVGGLLQSDPRLSGLLAPRFFNSPLKGKQQ